MFLDRTIGWLVRNYRRAVFKRKTGIKHNDFRLTGKVNILSSSINLTIGKNVTISDGVTFWGDAPIIIGDNVSIGLRTTIAAVGRPGGITIGDNVLIAADCYIIDCDHGVMKGIPIRNQPQQSAPVVIGDDVWLAQNVTVLKGSIIGDGAVVGAKALVKGTVPSNAICVGIPARVIKSRE